MGYLREKKSFHDIGSVVQGDVLKQIPDVFDDEAIKNSIRNIFTIQKGEVPGHPEFGNPLGLNLFDQIDDTIVETFKTAIFSELALWEPRVTIQDMSIDVMPDQNRIIVGIQYVANSGNTVYEEDLYIPFSANTGTFIDGRRTINMGNIPTQTN